MTAGSPEDPRLDQTAVAALQDALAAEHAALWCYSLAVAFLAGGRRGAGPRGRSARTASCAARSRRRSPSSAPQRSRRSPPTPRRGRSSTPRPPPRSLVVAETDALAAWRSVLERTTDRALRQAALDTLTAGTLRCARWRVAVGERPAIPIFPGRP